MHSYQLSFYFFYLHSFSTLLASLTNPPTCSNNQSVLHLLPLHSVTTSLHFYTSLLSPATSTAKRTYYKADYPDAFLAHNRSNSALTPHLCILPLIAKTWNMLLLGGSSSSPYVLDLIFLAQTRAESCILRHSNSSLSVNYYLLMMRLNLFYPSFIFAILWIQGISTSCFLTSLC